MIVRRRPSWLLLLLSLACQREVDEPTETATPSSSSSSSSSSSTGATGSTGPTTGASSTAGPEDGCAYHAAGDWAQCKTGNVTDNAACGWEESEQTHGMALCLTPTSGAFNVCGVRDCVDVCDCYAPPSTGTAVPVCAAILGSGKNGCALYCAGGQVCPDGMMCQTGYCYWPN